MDVCRIRARGAVEHASRPYATRESWRLRRRPAPDGLAVLLVAGAAGGNRVLALLPLRACGTSLDQAHHATHTGVPALRPVALSFVVATGSTFLLEEPLRRARRHRRARAVRIR